VLKRTRRNIGLILIAVSVILFAYFFSACVYESSLLDVLKRLLPCTVLFLISGLMLVGGLILFGKSIFAEDLD